MSDGISFLKSFGVSVSGVENATRNAEERIKQKCSQRRKPTLAEIEILNAQIEQEITGAIDDLRDDVLKRVEIPQGASAEEVLYRLQLVEKVKISVKQFFHWICNKIEKAVDLIRDFVINAATCVIDGISQIEPETIITILKAVSVIFQGALMFIL